MSKKKLVKNALKRPELYSPDELLYFQMWLRAREYRKDRKRKLAVLNLERNLLL